MRYSEAHITSVSCLLILIQTSCSVVVVVGFVVGLVLLVLALVHGAVRNLSSTRSLFRARYCCVRAACVRARTLSTVRARSQPHNQLQLPPLPRPQLTADLTPSVFTSPLTCDNVLPCPPDHPPHPPRHNGVPGLRGLQLQGSDGVHSVLFSRPRPGQACRKDGPRTQGPRY